MTEKRATKEKMDAWDKLGIAFFIMLGLVILFFVGLLGWAFVEFILWLTNR